MLRKMAIFNLWVVRHGQTSYNKQNMIQGHLDIPLSPTGIEQAKVTGSYLKDTRFDYAYGSPLKRASQTAEFILEANNFFEGTIHFDERLKERNFGICDGKSLKELKQAAAKENKTLAEFCPPGGETLQQLSDRVVSFFEELCRFMQDESMKVKSLDTQIKNKLTTESDINAATEKSQSINGCTSNAQPGSISASLNDGTSQKLSLKNSDLTPSATCNVLLVSHGGFIRQLFRHLFNDFGCQLQPNIKNTIGITPNTAVSKFVISVDKDCEPDISCVQLHYAGHLSGIEGGSSAVVRTDNDVAL